MTKPKSNYIPRKRISTICPYCEKEFKIGAAEYRQRKNLNGKEPGCGCIKKRKDNLPV